MSKSSDMGQRLAWAREQAGLTILQAATVTGIPSHIIQHIEGGSRIIMIGLIEAMTEAYDVDSKWVNTGIERDVVIPETSILSIEEREDLRRLLARRRQTA